MRAGGVSAVHVTAAYWEDPAQTMAEIGRWRRRFADHADLIAPAASGEDVRRIAACGKTAIILGFQNASPIGDDLNLVEIFHLLGARFMQLSYNNQSLLAAGCYEKDDSGLSRFGRAALREMNRVGLVADMSHSGERSTLEAIEHSRRPVAITHANPASWHSCARNKSPAVLRELFAGGGMLGLSAYPLHLRGESDCSLESFCRMAAEIASTFGVDGIGLGTDLCQGRGRETLAYMRDGRWNPNDDPLPEWPAPPPWFQSNLDFSNIAAGLAQAGFNQGEVKQIMGENWLRFFDKSFGAE